MKRSLVLPEDDDDDESKRALCLTLVKQVHSTLGSDSEKSQIFKTVLMDFRDGKISTSDLISRVKQVLVGHDHLLRVFQFVPPKRVNPKAKEITTGIHNQPPTKRRILSKQLSSHIQKTTDFCNRVLMNFIDDDNGGYESFHELLSKFDDKNNDQKEAFTHAKKELNILFKNHPNLSIELSTLMDDEEEEEAPAPVRREKEKGKNYPRSRQKRHPCFERLFKVADEHEPYDVMLASLECAIERLEEYVEKVKEDMKNPSPTPCQYILHNYLSTINLRFIKKVYGGEDRVIEYLQADPIKVGEIILGRLRQKLEELNDWMNEAGKKWTQVSKECHEILQREHERLKGLELKKINSITD